MLKRIFLFVLMFAIILGCFTACGKKSDEELIERRIGSFVKAYNAGDLDKVIENLSYSERTKMQSYIKLIEGIGFSYSGVSGNLDMSSIFGVAMGSTTDGDMMQINIEAINITDGDKAEVDVSVKMKNKYIEEIQSGRIDMVKEDDDWFIKDMNTWKSTEGSSSSKQTASGNKNSSSTTGNGKTALNPFDSLQYTITGISPYCEVAVNNQNCSTEVQRYVRFSFDKEHYANGDTVVVTAALGYGAGDYTLSKTRHEFKLSGQPEYITSLSGVDISDIEDELSDYINSQIAAAVGQHYLFDIAADNYWGSYKTTEEPNPERIYFASLKKIKEDDNMDFYNSLNYIYSILATTEDVNGAEENVRVYVNISAYNIVKYPNGRVKWGMDDPNAYDFQHKAGVNGVEGLVTTTVTVLSSNYNISQIR